MLLVSVPALLTPAAVSYEQLMVGGFFLGLAGSSFSAGVGFVSRWFTAEKQGSALGVYGLGNIGQSAAVFLGPLLAVSLGWQNVFRGIAVVLVVWAIVFAVLARDAPVPVRPKTIGEMLGLLARERLSWALGFLLSYLRRFCRVLDLSAESAQRSISSGSGGRGISHRRLRNPRNPATPSGRMARRPHRRRASALRRLLHGDSLRPAAGMAVLMGLGNGAVFKLVPQYFPGETGTVTGLVGAMGGLGGFFPPLLLGFFRDHMGTVWPGFFLLALLSLLLWLVNARVFVPRQDALEIKVPEHLRRTADQVRAGVWATLFTLLLIAAIVVGSRNLQNFDPALVIYTFAIIFAT